MQGYKIYEQILSTGIDYGIGLLFVFTIVFIALRYALRFADVDEVKECDHRFELKHITNTKHDPSCVYCGKKLSELIK